MGDTLNLDVTGAVNPVFSNPALPDGTLTSDVALVSWTSIEQLPVPAGLGFSLDFQPLASLPVQSGFTAVLQTTAYTDAQDHGWITAPSGGYDNISNALALDARQALLRDGATGTAAGVFQVDLTSGQPVQLAALLGDPLSARDNITVEYMVEGGAWTPFNASSTNMAYAKNEFPTVLTTTGALADTDFDGEYSVFVRVSDSGGATPNWAWAGMDVRPPARIPALTVTRTTAGIDPLFADGLTVDKYSVSGAAAGAVLTVAPEFGTVLNDARSDIPGVQVIADATGTATFRVRRDGRRRQVPRGGARALHRRQRPPVGEQRGTSAFDRGRRPGSPSPSPTQSETGFSAPGRGSSTSMFRTPASTRRRS